MLLLSLTKSLCTTQLKKNLLLQHCSLCNAWEDCRLPWAQSRLFLLEVEQSYSNLKQKRSNELLVSSNPWRCIADREAVGLFSLIHMSGTRLVGSFVLLGSGWHGRARAPAKVHPRVMLSANAHSCCPCRAAVHLLLVNPVPATTNPPPALPSIQDHGTEGKPQHNWAKPEPPPWGM